MPISSGANNWPKTYWSRPPKKPGVHSRVVVVDRPEQPELAGPSAPASPQVTYRTPSPPPFNPSPPRTPPRQPRAVVEETVRYEPPPPRREHPPTPPPPTPPPININRTVTTTNHHMPPPEPQQTRIRSTRYDRRYDRHGYGGSGGRTTVQRGTGYDRYHNGYDYYTDQNDRTCCSNSLFNSGKAGGDTGCCQGGLFSNRRYPYGAEDYYQMPGDGRHRCCAMVAGIIAGLLALGLLIGLLAGLMPVLQRQNAENSITSQSTYANGKMYNGIYYYQVTNPPDLFYLALGPGIPCNKYNNNSATKAPVTVTKVVTVTGTTPTMTTKTTLPDCDSITTNFVQVQGLSVSTTTVSWANQFPNGAAQNSHRSVTTTTCFALAAIGYVMRWSP